jgi:hypothetical protein
MIGPAVINTLLLAVAWSLLWRRIRYTHVIWGEDACSLLRLLLVLAVRCVVWQGVCGWEEEEVYSYSTIRRIQRYYRGTQGACGRLRLGVTGTPDVRRV